MKKFVFSKLLVTFLALTMVLTMVACGSDDEKFVATNEDAADAVNAFFASVEDGASNLTKEELMGQIPTYEELMTQLALEQNKNQYFTDVKSAIDSIKGEIGQINVKATIDGTTINTGDKELLYAGMKDGQLYISAVNGLESDAEKIAVYVCYNDDSVYAIMSNTDADGLVITDGVQFSYSDKYDELVGMLPDLKADYDMAIEQLEASLDEMFVALESASAGLGELTLPAISADSLEKLEGKKNAFRLTDAYIESLLRAVLTDSMGGNMLPESMKEEMNEQINEMIKQITDAVDVYPYFTLVAKGQISGVGVYADVNIEAFQTGIKGAANMSAAAGASSADVCKLDLYVGADEMSCDLDLAFAELGHVKCDIEADDKGFDSSIDVSVNGITFVSTMESTATKTDAQTTVTVPQLLTLVAKVESTTTFDDETGALMSTTTKNTLSLKCTDLSAVEDVLDGEGDDDYMSEDPAIPFEGEVTMTTTMNPGNLMAANADIFSYAYTLNAQGGSADETFAADMSADFSVKSQEAGTYRFATAVDADIQNAGEEAEVIDLEASFCLSISDAKNFPSALPEDMADLLDAMKKDPNLNSFDDMIADTEGDNKDEECALCRDLYPVEDMTVLYGTEMTICIDCYEQLEAGIE